MADETKLPLTSHDVNAERLAQLRELFPEAFTEGRLDIVRLNQLLGDNIADGPERYGLSWSGKSEAIKNIQTLTSGTLLPGRDESVNFDTTENLIIEGDNLEVLKLLQGGWHGRVKMIYIDPPYNTGGDFIYPDNYKEGLADYLKFSGQVSGEGVKLTTNPETDGRYHSKWLTMMYPRLFLARNLLRKDGVIFVTIDDHEVHNLRAVMNEIFGEENFVANVIWEKKYTRANDAKFFSDNHDHILLFVKSRLAFNLNLLSRSEEQESAYSNPDNDSRGDWKATPLHAKSGTNTSPFRFKNNVVWSPPTGTFRRFSDEAMARMDENNEIWFGSTGKSTPQRKSFLSEVKQGLTPTTIWTHEEVGHNHEANNELKEIALGGIFENPKPSRLVQRMLQLATNPNEQHIILDFFAGSGTTAQAVLELNAQDGGNRKFMLVQLPEPTGRKDFPTIVEITKERVRRVIKKLEKANEDKLPLRDATNRTDTTNGMDRGFRVFKLSSSNFKVWEAASAPKDAAGLAEQLKLMAHNVVEDRGDEALLYELVLKSNLPLTVKIQSDKIGGQTIYEVMDGTLMICLERKITQETLRGMIARKPKGVICLDIAFAGNDQLKTNTVLEMKSHGIEFHTA